MKTLTRHRRKKVEALWKELAFRPFCASAICNTALHVPELTDKALELFLRPENLKRCLDDAYYLGMLFENLPEKQVLICQKLIELMEVDEESYIFGESRLELMSKFPAVKDVATQGLENLKKIYTDDEKWLRVKRRDLHARDMYQKILKASGRPERKVKQVYAGSGLGDAL